MPREPLSAADAITFLDKKECEKCGERMPASRLDDHLKEEYYIRKIGDDRRKEAFKDLQKAAVAMYDRQAQEALKKSPIITSSTQSVDTLGYEAFVRSRLELYERGLISKERLQASIADVRID